MKNYVGISLDHSGSMQGVRFEAMQDFNKIVETLKTQSVKEEIDTIVSVMQSSIMSVKGTVNKFSVVNSSVVAVKPLTVYDTSGSATLVLDSVLDVIEAFEKLPDANSKDVSFLLMVVTDGQDNGSVRRAKLAEKLKQLNALDNWTVTFRVPNGGRSGLRQFGIPDGNIVEFNAADRTEYAASTVATVQAVEKFYTTRKLGVRKVSNFYEPTVNLDANQVKRELTNISKKVRIVRVTKDDDGKKIQDFMLDKTGGYTLGTVFYQLTKKEELEDNKLIVVWDKLSGNYYTGADARHLLNLPSAGKIKLAPADENAQYQVFVQSMSVNRKLVGGTKVVVLDHSVIQSM
jgi:uncharacterized protein YegL